MARTASDKPKGKHLGATVPPEVADWFESRQWDERRKVSDLVRDALTAYATKNGYKPAESAPQK